MKNWDWKLKALAWETVDDILKGVGVPEIRHVEEAPRSFALQVRRRCTDQERDEFVARKERGDYTARLFEKGIV